MTAIETTAPDHDDTIDSITATAAALGLYAVATFVPWSQSRNKGEKSPSLNWGVELRRHSGPLAKKAARVYRPAEVAKGEATGAAVLPSRTVLTCDYGTGSGHCPASNVAGRVDKWDRAQMIRKECEEGFAAMRPLYGGHIGMDRKRPLLPSLADVLSSLVLESSVLDAGGFEPWAREYGYETDSRKAESIYRECLEQALALRGALGDKGMERLRLACQNY